MSPRRSHRLVLGPFRPTLEAALAAEIRAAKKGDPGAPVVVLVGSNLLALHLNRVLARAMPLWNVRFFTFAELARKLGSALLLARGRRPLPELAGHYVMRGVIRENAGGYFAPVAGLPGFVRTAAASVADLKEAGLGPEAVRKLKSPKAEAFAGIFEAYERTLDSLGFHDDADLLAAAAEAAKESGFVESAAFIAYGFYDLNGLQRRMLLAVAGRARSAAALVPWQDAPAYEYAEPLVKYLQSNGFKAASPAPEPDVLVARLFRPLEGEPLDPSAFRVLSVAGEAREAREAVRQVFEFARAGVPFHEVAVLVRNPEAYSRLMRDAFELRGVPYFASRGAPLAETVEARGLLLLADLLASDFRRADVMEFVHFAPVPFEALIGRRPDLAAWELLSIEAGIFAGPEQWKARLARLERSQPDEDEEPDTAVAAELPSLRAFVGRLIEARESVPASGSWSEVAGALVRAYEQFTAPTERRALVASEVRKLCALDALGSPATFADVREAASELLAGAAMPARGFQRGKVFIGGLFESRGLAFRAVILPGLVEKGFPAPGRQDPVLLDAERFDLSRAERSTHLPPKGARTAEERLLFALAIAAGSERVTLTFPRLDPATARERIPSYFLVRLVEALTGRGCNYSNLQAAPCFKRVPMFATSGDAEALDLDEFDLQSVAELAGSRTPEEALYLAAVTESFGRGVEAETARWQEKVFTRFDGRVTSVRVDLGDEPVVSPTRLERYAMCPFVYFIEKVLGIQALEEPEAVLGIPPMERGALVHRILYKGYSTCCAGKGPPSASELGAALRRAAEAEFRRLSMTGPALTWAIDRAEILADLARFAALDADECARLGAQPLWFETRFGMKRRGGGESPASTEEPLELRAGNTHFRFKGKIDRIDAIGQDEARVIDYKTGGAWDVKADRFLGGRALQLPVYLLAADMLLRRLKRRALRAEYVFATSRGGFRSVGFERATLENRRTDFDRILLTINDGIRNGLFIMKPDKSRCMFCEFGDLCGPNNDILFERKKEDPAAAGLLALEDIE